MKFLLFVLNLLLVCIVSSAQVNSDYHYVKGYYRKNGTYVQGHYKTNSNLTNRDNYSTKPNINPWTGEPGKIEPNAYYYQSYAPQKKSDYFSKEYNEAKELNDQKRYNESINICEKLIQTHEIPFFTTELLGWNYIATGKYQLAINAFERNYKLDKSYFSASNLYLSYLLNNETSKAESLKKSISGDTLFYKNFNLNFASDLRKLDLNFGIPNQEILKIILDNENLYLGENLLNATYTCNNCEIEFIAKTCFTLVREF